MKITKQFAITFAEKWISSWNNREIGSILSHYSEDVVFSSPFILKSQIDSEGTIHGKNELKKYFGMALEGNIDLHFDLKHIMVGIKSITLIYIRSGKMLASEVMIFNEEGRVIEGLSHYPADDFPCP